MMLNDRVCTIKLLGKQHAHHAMWQGQFGQAPQPISALLEAGVQAIRTADDETHITPQALPKRCSFFGQL
jgi:hypothetical protein